MTDQPGKQRSGDQPSLLESLDYRKIFEEAPDGMSISRLDSGLFLEINQGFTDIFGYPREEIIGKTSYELKFWHNIMDRAALVAQLQDAASVENFQADIIGRDGVLIHTMMSVKLLTLDAGPCLLVLFKNITDYAETVKALRASEKKFKDIFEMTPDSMIISGRDGIIYDVNPVLLNRTGYSREEIIGRTTTEIGFWDDLRQREAFLALLEEQGVVRNLEINVKARGGERRVVLASSMPFVMDGAPRILTIARDITELKQAKKLLHEEESRFRDLLLERQAILEAIPDAVILWSRERRVVWTNNNAKEYLKVNVQSAVGKSCKDLCQASHLHEDCPIHQCFASGTAAEKIEKFSNGESWDVKVYPVASSGGQVDKVLSLSRNITERMRLREEANRSSRLTALGELAAGVAHEINNPTGLILMNASLLKDIVEDLRPVLEQYIREPGTLRLGGLAYQRAVDELPDVLSEVIESGQRIKQIVEDLKDFSRPAPHDTFEPVDLNAVVAKSLRLLRIVINKATDNFVVDYDQSLPKVMGNARQLEQVMVNLVSNASQALRERSESLVVAVYGEPESRNICIKVWDEGRGIEAKILDQITDPFFTTRRESGGTGLGLSVTSRIVEEHGGRLYFESTPEYGTTVTVKLPAIDTSEEKGMI